MKREIGDGDNVSSSGAKLETAKNGIGGRIRQVRGKRSQDEFSDAYGIGLRSLARYEREETPPDAAFLAAVVEREGVDGSWLLTGKDFGVPVVAPNGVRSLDPEEIDLLLETFVAVEGILSKNGRHATHDQKKAVTIKMFDEARRLGTAGGVELLRSKGLDSSQNRA